MAFKHVLAIETSCDDTSVAIVREDGWVEAVCSANQDLQHKAFGGVVPEIASRNHTMTILPLVDECLSRARFSWSQIEGLAVTSRPGLVGSLLVGLVTAKALALAKELPFIGLNHLEAHLLAPFLKDEKFSAPASFKFPYVALAISGGHSHLCIVEDLGVYRVLGRTVDDAAGEAYDKFAKMLGLGFPGGVQVDRLAAQGRTTAYSFPRPLIKEENFQFSFSGLKTAALRLLETLPAEAIRENLNDLCASYQEAIVDVLMAKLDRAVQTTGLKRAVLTGGVSANSRLRQVATEWAQAKNIELVIPPLRYCTDNAAMVGLAGIWRLNRGERSSHDLPPMPTSLPADFIEAGMP